MNAAKKKRLTAAGWKFGSAADFLGLSAAEAAYLDMHFALAERLHEERRRRKPTQSKLARLIASSRSRVAKMEAGDSSVSLDSLISALLALGVEKKAIGRSISRAAG